MGLTRIASIDLFEQQQYPLRLQNSRGNMEGLVGHHEKVVSTGFQRFKCFASILEARGFPPSFAVVAGTECSLQLVEKRGIIRGQKPGKNRPDRGTKQVPQIGTWWFNANRP